MAVELNFSPTQMAILALLRAEDKNGNKYAPIPGKTHLIKELFAIHKTNIGSKLLDELNFEPYNYGPFDETIFAALDALKDAGIVNFDSSSTKYVKIMLTPKGVQIADKFWNKLKDDIKSLFTYVKINLNHLSSELLLDQIYSAHPEMTIYSISKVAEKYRRKNK